MKNLLLLLMIAGAAFAGAGMISKTQKVKGIVTDATTKEPLKNATVKVFRNGKLISTKLTNDSGQYAITGIQPGQYDISFSASGFGETKVTDVSVSKAGTTPLDIALNLKGNTLNSMEVIKYNNPLAESDKSKFSSPDKEEDQYKSANGAANEMQPRSGIISYNQNRESLGKKAERGVYYHDDGDQTVQKYSDRKLLSDSTIPNGEFNTEEYGSLIENDWKKVKNEALSTFSIDVDAASYSNIRRFLSNGQMPPKDAVRIEEMVNYFKYNYPQPKNGEPFSITTEEAACPWNAKHQLVMIGMQGKIIPTENLPATNLTFLIDVSGSMDEPNKLPLVKASLKMLTEQLRAKDRVAIVVYAGNAGLVLPSTPGSEKEKIIEALDRLEAGGSTAGGAGIQLAYKIAKENFFKDGNNRVILATDGDFNVGASSDGELVRMIEEKRKDNIFLTVLGFGMGNYKDEKMEQLADKGNGNHTYIDNLMEAKKVLVNEFGGTLFTIAKDVKLQLEWNPANIKAYRLIGYENRLLNKEDFNDDKKDAGELGSGHTVTALYEVIPANSDEDPSGKVDPLKYQKEPEPVKTALGGEIMTVKLRYKKPDEDNSKLLSYVLKQRDLFKYTQPSENMQWASTVTEFGLILRDSKFRGSSSLSDVLLKAKASKGTDEQGYRAEFIRMVEMAQLYAKK